MKRDEVTGSPRVNAPKTARPGSTPLQIPYIPPAPRRAILKLKATPKGPVALQKKHNIEAKAQAGGRGNNITIGGKNNALNVVGGYGNGNEFAPQQFVAGKITDVSDSDESHGVTGLDEDSDCLSPSETSDKSTCLEITVDNGNDNELAKKGVTLTPPPAQSLKSETEPSIPTPPCSNVSREKVPILNQISACTVYSHDSASQIFTDEPLNVGVFAKPDDIDLNH